MGNLSKLQHELSPHNMSRGVGGGGGGGGGSFKRELPFCIMISIAANNVDQKILTLPDATLGLCLHEHVSGCT